MGNPTAAGAWLIVLMDDIAPVSIAKSAVGMPWNWRIGPARSRAANGLNVAITSTPSARGAHRCSPTQFQRAAQGGRDQRLTWPRRICAATGDSGVLLKVPLGEISEAYDLKVLNGALVVRTISGLSASSFA